MGDGHAPYEGMDHIMIRCRMDRRDAIAALLALIAAPRSSSPSAFAKATADKQALKPSGPPDLTSLTIAEAASRIAKRQLSPLDLTNAYLARIDKLNKDLNAYIT